ncbi:MAG: cytochrome ubiquinol oxidase subunit I [Verrucomicrobiota bacterium]
MDVEILSRLQFAFTISFHYIFPVLTIGLGVVLVVIEAFYLATKDQIYRVMGKFWTRVFGLMFAIGVASGIVMEFEFGTNWATYSRFVGDVFGSALAAEGIFAFFLESGFLALLLFGWDKVGPKLHFFATCMVAFGSHFSAVWIVIANSWMQTPAGFELARRVTDENGRAVFDANGDPLLVTLPPDYEFQPGDFDTVIAKITDFWAMIFNPSAMERLTHVILGCWLAGAFLVISVGAFYLLRRRHREFAVRSIKIGLVFAAFTSLVQLVSGSISAKGVMENQPTKLAAMEGIFKTEDYTPMSAFGWVDVENRETYSLAIPGMLSYLAHGDFETPVKGLDQFPEDEWPPVQITFQAYHIMINIGLALIVLSWTGIYLWWRGWLWEPESSKFARWYLGVMVFAVLLPQIANQCGWYTAEVGRQPWIVWQLMRTSEGLSKSVTAEMVLASLIMFFLIYALLFALFIYLLHRKIMHGPDDTHLDKPDPDQRAIIPEKLAD